MSITSIILAAGQGTRMRSALPKVLHSLAGRPLIAYAVENSASVSSQEPVVVIGHGAEQVQKAISGVRFVMQDQQLGTGHAVLCAESLLKGATDWVIITSADMPFISSKTLQQMMELQQSNSGPITMLTVIQADSHGFGRVLRAADGSVQEIVEEAVAAPEILALKECNVGAYVVKAAWLWDALHHLPLSPKGEYYLTDIVGLAVQAGLKVQAVTLQNPLEAIGINTRVHLAEAEAIARRSINQQHMLNGVTFINPEMTYIDAEVEIGADTIIYPNTYLRGKTRIGSDCVLGPDTILSDSQVGSGCTVLASVMEHAIVEDDVEMGPFCHLRKGAHLASHVHMGNFGEVKNSYLGEGTKMGHFSYIGDATIGHEVNIGAGTITCNFDGQHKHHTDIGDDAFIGIDTMLVAPLKIGARAHTGAGSVVTHDVPEDATVVGVPARLYKKAEGGEH